MKRSLPWLPLLLAVLGLLALSAVVWWLGPLLPFGDSQPLQPLWPRVLLLALLWGGSSGWQAFKSWRRQRTNTALLQRLSGGPSATEKEAQVLAQRFAEAVQKLKSRGGKSGLTGLTWLTGLMGGSVQLYELPWYVFVGAPGSGKTTALMNAGLQFLLQDSGGKASVQGVGGTRNCEWWFTQDAVLIDTAGRYATQESDRDVDASAWDNFLALLKKTRPRQPINGVLLTVNVQDLLQQGSAERQQHAAQLRARLAELQTKLGVRSPVYVLVTKADLLGGFNESFEALDKDGRDQVWGFTFAADAPAGSDPMHSFIDRYQELQQRLVAQLPGRLQAERDVLRRSAIFAFPQEFAALRPVLNDFLRAVFSGGGTLEAAPLVRGVYFTSGTQEGTPIDRVMGALGRSFGMDTRAAAVAPGRGKSYFLQRLLKDLIFAERGLGALNPVAEKRRATLRLGAVVTMGVATCAVLAGWVLSRANNLDHAAQVAARLPALKAAVDGLPPATSADLAALPQPLSQLRDAARLPGAAGQPGLDPAAPPLLHGLGLYQGEKLNAAAQMAYQRLLEKQFAPRVARRLEERLRAANSSNLEQAYEALKAYTMLHQPQQFDAAYLKAWIGADWDVNLAQLPPEARSQLDTHLDTMLALGPPRAVLPKDDALVGSVREMLSAYPLEYRAYSRIKRQYTAGSVPDFSVAGAAGPQAAQVFESASAEPLSKGISGLYTRDGYRKLVLPAVQKATLALAAEEAWVLGLKADAARLRDATVGSALTDKVRRLYFQDYIKTWDKYLADVRLVKLNDPERALAVSRLLAAVDSPLASYVRGVSAETKLVQAAPNPLDKALVQAKADAAKLTGAAPADAAVGGGTGGGPLERMVDDNFKGMHRLVTGEPPPLNETLKLFGELHAQLAAVDAAKKSKSPPPPGGGAEKIKSAAIDQPEVVRGMLAQLADAAIGQTSGAVRQDLNTELKPVTDTCTRAVNGRYPFASGSAADVTPDDFGQVFGAGGLLDDFFQRRLQSLVDISTPQWTYKPLTDGTRPVAPAALAEFQRAQRIREVFFRAGGKAPGVRLELRLSEMDPALKEVVLDIDGQVQKLTSGGPSILVSAPSARMASELKLSTGLGNAGPLVTTRGPWALFRLFDNFQVEPGAAPEKFSVIMNLDGKRARMEVLASSVFNPFQMREIKQFRCPAAL